MQPDNQSHPRQGIIPPPPPPSGTNSDQPNYQQANIPPNYQTDNGQPSYQHQQQQPMQPQNMQYPNQQSAHNPQVAVPQTPQNAAQSGIAMDQVSTSQQPHKVAKAPTPNYSERSGRGDGHNLAGVPEEFMKLFEHDESEVIMYQALRHPIGVFAIYAVGGLAIIMVIVSLVVLMGDSSIFGAASGGFISIASIVAIFLIAFIALVSLIGAYVYKRSRMILTNQKVVLIQYHSLFAREVSQLNIGEVEDVNVAQNSIFDRILHTGKITIETSGEQNNYHLSLIQNPHDFAQKTIQAHEGSIAQYGN